MTNDECNKYIKNYLEKDKTRSAIMLTAPWGAGKSYYIKNNLCKYLRENKLDYAIVSLYGLNSLKEINKQLFLEIRLQKQKKTRKFLGAFGKTVASGTAILGKTLLKYLANVDIDFNNIKEPNYEKLYELVNLKNKLIVFEDLERANIDIIEFLGYVNNLVEQDGVKVLLVANEDEFIHKETAQKEDKSTPSTKNSNLNNADNKERYTKETEEYLRKKEKTISDTLVYDYPKEESLRSIIGEFFSDNLRSLLTEDNYIHDITTVMKTVESQNLRAIMYACQKTSDMLSLYGETINKDFVKFLLCSVIAFSCRLKKGKECKWKNIEDSPSELGTAVFPLYKVCYDYLTKQLFNGDLLKQAEQNYIRRKQVENAKTEFNRYIDVLRYYYNSTEQNVSDAIVHIKDLLSKNESSEYTQYGTLANYLIALKDCVDNVSDIEDCKKIMIDNIRSIANDSAIEESILYHDGIELEDPDKKQELASFKESLIEELHYKKQASLTFDNTANWVNNFVKYVENNQTDYLNARSFAKNIDIEKFIEGIKQCLSSDIAQIRGAFLSVYSSANIGEFLSEDKETLIKLKETVEKDCLNFNGFDKIQKKQIQWFISNLDEIIQKL